VSLIDPIGTAKPACVNRSQEILDDRQYEAYFSPKKPSDGISD